ncbi:MAG: DUF4124 domain-containing protein [Kangiellaceae bacterium]|nr:DUF4124 domain-containing protein [Kangiellaceae bacterium]MCW8997386.1 DUF4124 domain-containing protein [Kangiellaceae bacterium]
MNKKLLLLFLALLSLNVSAQDKKKIYRWVDKDGNVHYSDEPRKGAVELKMKEVPTVNMTPPVPLKDIQSPIEEQTQPFAGYTSAHIVSPAADGVIRNNAQTVIVELAIEPALGNGHRIRIFIDGKPIKETNQTSGIKLEKMEFGKHTINFVILDHDGRVIFNSESNSFHLLNFINPKRRGK